MFLGWFSLRPAKQPRLSGGIELGYRPRRAASRRVLEKAGLTLVRIFFEQWPELIEGGEHGDVEYAVTREVWQRASGPPSTP